MSPFARGNKKQRTRFSQGIVGEVEAGSPVLTVGVYGYVGSVAVLGLG